jgi:beta-lactamase class A
MRVLRAWACALALLPAACVGRSGQERVAPSAPPLRSAPAVVAAPLVAPPGSVRQPPAALVRRIAELGRSFDGVVGIAVRDVQAGWTVSYNGASLFPQQSVSKLWVAITVLDAVDRGRLRLDQEVVIRRDDLTLFHQPIRALVGADGYRTTIRALLEQAMQRSDNTANDKLLWTAGGPDAVRAMLARGGIAGVRFGPGERQLQSRTAGLEWRQDMADGNGFYAARSALPMATRKAALRRYLADPIDGASPDGITAGLSRLRKGELLSAASTQHLLALMAGSKTGPQRMRAGIGPGWAFAHKTGTGQELGGLATGYNDVGLVTAPDGHTYAVAVMIGSTSLPIPARQQLMSNVTRAIVAQALPA